MQFDKKNRCLQIIFFGMKDASAEAGSALLYVLILTAVGSSLIAVTTNRVDQYKAETKKLEASLFMQDALTNFNQRLSCPGGVIRVKKGSCGENAGITLSIQEIRRHVADATPQTIATLGVMPPTYRGYEYFDMLQLRVACYKQESPYAPSGQPMSTRLKQQPCVLLKNIDKNLSPYIGSNLLSAEAERFGDDVKTIQEKIVPQIDKKMEAIRDEIKRLEELKDAAGKQVYADSLVYRTATERYNAAYGPYVQALTTYNSYTGTYNQLASACFSGCAADDPRLPGIYAAQAQRDAYYPTFYSAYQQFVAAANEYNAAVANLKKSTDIFNGYVSAIDTENRKLAGYQTMLRYLASITEGKNLVLRNSQLAAVQARGGILANLLRHGTRGAAYKASSMLPSPDDDGLKSPQTTPAEADVVTLGMLKLRPFCSVDEDGTARMRFFAKVIDFPAGGFPGVNVAIEFENRQKKIRELLINSGKKIRDGWVKMPANFTPQDCKVIEEEEPPLSGPENWTMDSLKKPKAN